MYELHDSRSPEQDPELAEPEELSGAASVNTARWCAS